MTMGRFAFIYFIIFMIFFQINISNVISEEVIPLKILDVKAQGHLGSNATVQCTVEPVTSNVTWLFKGEPLVIDDVLYKIKITNFSKYKDADGNERHNQLSSLMMPKTSIEMHGNYTCQVSLPKAEQSLRKQVLLDLRLKTRLLAKTPSPVKVNATYPVSMSCEFEGFGLSKIKWRRSKDSQATSGEPLNTHSINVNATNAIGTLNLTSVIRTDNGTYYCDARDPVTETVVSGSVDLLVIDKPEVSIEYIKAVGATRIYLNWTVNDGNLPIESYTLQYKNGSETWTYYNTPIGGGNLSFVIGGLTPLTPYQLKLTAKNKMGYSKPYMDSNVIKTLASDPHFVPNVTIKGFSMSSMTIGWPPPSSEQAEFVHYYELAAQEQNNTNSSPKEAIYSGGSSYLPYMFDSLLPATTYIFKVRACSELTRECGNWSEPTLGSTLDGAAGPPSDMTLSCNHDVFSHSNFLLVEWKPPAVPNGQIEIYNLEVTGMATYMNAEGKWENATWGPKVRHVRGSHARFDNMPANTNFTVSVSAVTRIKRPGEAVTMHCSTPPSVPLRDTLRVKWDKVFDDGKFMFKLQVPRVTERNGAICCYRVFIVRIPWGQRLGDLPSPENVPVVSYQQAHDTKKVGAYVAEIFTSDNVYLHSHVIVGDGDSPTAKDAKSMQQCMRCVASIQRAFTTTVGTVPITTTTGATGAKKEDEDDFLGEEKEQMDQPPNGWVDYGGGKSPVYRKKYQNNRSYLDNNRYSELPVPDPDQRLFKRQTEKGFKTENFDRIMSELPQDSDTKRLEMVKGNEVGIKEKETDAELINLRAEDKVVAQSGPLSWQVFDGHLDTSSNYTGFVEMIVHTANDDLVFPAYTDYLPMLKPGPTYVPDGNEAMLELILKVVCGVLSVVLVCLFFICVYHTHQRRKEQQGMEMQTLHATLRNLCQGLKGGRHQLVAHSPPDMPPIAKDDLAAAYLERSADSDYGFQREFELLPDCFPDRTMYASEARENTSKNRYPDIKAYDQTRVKLSQIDSIVGSDYINANYVMGYKERKRFICAQGPTDATVTDFWRMIWEQNLDLVVMLTNLEEYSKVKCSKYWPDEAQGEKVFGSIAVQHLSEKRYSDYIVRELKVTRQKPASTAESSPIIVENNGIAKRNGAANDMHSNSSSSPSSPKDTSTASGRPEQAASPQLGSTACGERVVRQYHFLMWKDFVAPEYPQAILKFIHRVNAVWSVCLSRPLLVHCSAGVGRTGTLVALDCLLQQLCAEQHVAVFNTVADLRRQRNFLVQSLKQYIFVYRALVEYAQYGDTEIPASKLKTTVDRLRNTPEGGDCCLMEEEFERIKKPALPEPLKSCAAGGGEENACKNRCEASLPFDRNRVILSPVPGRDYSTYINATFIEGYDNSESYIITQDPLPNTVSDFWRMISEQGATTIVMLSELGEGERKCPRYWDDGSVQYEHITVQYEHSESCPYYTKREFRVTNSKSQEWLSVRQLQYHGWPTVAGQVPEVTRGLAELADAASRFPRNPAAGPMVVHCNLGTERSSMFVALCTLIMQLRMERRVDVAALARKIRSQRSGCLDTFLQYEFLHRAIVNYAELHNLLEDS